MVASRSIPPPQDIANDSLVESGDKTRLCTWGTMSDEELQGVLEDAKAPAATIMDARIRLISHIVLL